MGFVDVAGAAYENGADILLGTDGGEDVGLAVSGNTGNLTDQFRDGPFGMSVGQGTPGTPDDDDPLLEFSRAVSAVSMSINGTNGFVDGFDAYVLSPEPTFSDLPGEEYAILINGVRLTEDELQAAVDAGTAGDVGYVVTSDGTLIKPDNDLAQTGTLIFDGGKIGIESIQVDTVHAVELPLDTTIGSSVVTFSVNTEPFVPGRDNPDDAIFGTPDEDDLEGTTGDDFIMALASDDRVAGGRGNDSIFGDEGNDTLIGNGGDDRLEGDDGNDRLFGRVGDDLLLGEDGRDVLGGQDGDDTMLGGAGIDRFGGGDGNDIVAGGDGNDDMRGSFGDDIYIGGAGDDFLIGENGNKSFLFSKTETDEEENDIITGFQPDSDQLVITGFNIGDEEGQISAEEFLAENASIKKANLIIDLGENHSVKIKNVFKGDLADAELSDVAFLIAGEDELPDGIALEDDVEDLDPHDVLDLGDGFFLPLVPLEEDDEEDDEGGGGGFDIVDNPNI
ncbi:MAG: calcium-binding protein [Pseudomonadota bacterium]